MPKKTCQERDHDQLGSVFRFNDEFAAERAGVKVEQGGPGS
jgi:hypothetical protein